MTRYAYAAILLLLVVPGCRSDGSDYRFTRFSMGTVVEYTLRAGDEASARVAVSRAHDEMERVSRLLWEDDSLSVVFGFNRAADSVAVPPEAADFLRRIRALAAITGGSFDPTIKPVIDVYDFGGDDPRPPTDETTSSALKAVGIGRFHLSAAGYASKDTAALALAVGAVAKGYAVDRAIAVLRDAGIPQAIVNAGGDLYCLGTRDGVPWRVGLRDPDDSSEMVAVLQIADAAVATSGDYQQFFDYEGIRYHHILNPATGRPARTVRSATVVANTAERADALATALFVRGSADGLEMITRLPDAEGLVVDSSGTVHWTPGMASFLVDDAATTPGRE